MDYRKYTNDWLKLWPTIAKKPHKYFNNKRNKSFFVLILKQLLTYCKVRHVIQSQLLTSHEVSLKIEEKGTVRLGKKTIQ